MGAGRSQSGCGFVERPADVLLQQKVRDTHHVPHSPVTSVEDGTASRHAAARKQAAKYAQAEEMRAPGQPADRTQSRKAHAPLRTDDWY
jgi:hypothetical protein